MSKEAENQLRNILSIAPVYSNTWDYPKTGEHKWVICKGRGWPGRVLEDGTYPYTVLPDGEVRVAELPRPIGIIHHPELVGGRDVIAAGMIKVREGEVNYLSNESGHYSPDADSLQYALIAFRFWQIPLAGDIEFDVRWAIAR